MICSSRKCGRGYYYCKSAIMITYTLFQRFYNKFITSQAYIFVVRCRKWHRHIQIYLSRGLTTDTPDPSRLSKNINSF
jgi:hypothetical protein